MTEEKKPKVDRLFVDRKDFDDFNRLKENDTPFAGVHDHEIFIAAMVVGFNEGCRIEIKNRKEFFHEKDLTNEENALIRALAVSEEGGLNVLLNKQKVYSIAEQFATGGISLLKAKALSGEYGSYAKKLESDLLRSYEKIQEEDSEKTKVPPESETILPTLLISKGESETLEFKSSMLYDFKKKTPNKELKIVIAKTVASFLNFNGGTLLIGVRNDGEVLGLEQDLSLLHNSSDEFEITFTNLINLYLGKMNRAYVSLKLEKVNDKEIAVIRIAKSPRPVFVRYKDEKGEQKEEFYIRAGNSSQFLEVCDASLYIKDHWPDLP
jgi:hypothetical protein